MDFFEQQDVARRRTGLLLFFFVLAVMLMIAGLYVAAIFIFGATQSKGPTHQPATDYWQPEILLGVAFVTGLIVGLGSLYKTAQLRSGGETVANMLGGRRLNPNTTDPAERRLLNVVEEMALAAGVVVPPVYVLDREKGINAFAAGFTPDDAVIGVNRGTLEFLTRDELQGVIAHEFSHILNGDMRLNIRLIGILHGILLLSIVGFYLLRGSSLGRSRDGKGAAPLLLLGLAAMVIGYIGLFFGRLIKASVSRQREYLADAAAVQFTRNPDGIAGVLKKIGGLSQGSQMDTPEAETASHMFFGSAFQRMSWNPFATHPPLVERIRRIDPNFDGNFPAVRPVQAQADRKPKPAKRDATPAARLGLGQRLRVDPLVLATAIGTLGEQHIQYSSQLLRQIPQPLLDAVHDTFSARAVVFALLLDEQPAQSQRQMRLIEQREGDATAAETSRLLPLVRQQGTEGRLPLMELVYGGLHGLSPQQYRHFRETVLALVAADQRLTLAEFVLQRVLLDHLDRHFDLAQPPRTRFGSVAAIRSQATVLMSALAYAGSTQPDLAQRAFRAAMDRLDLPGPQPAMLPVAELGVKHLSEALAQATESAPRVKKQLLMAAVVAVATDEQVSVVEAELLRAIATTLDCPLPPIFGRAASVPAEVVEDEG